LAIIDFLTNAFFFRINVSSSQHRPRNTVQLWEETANRSSLHRSWGLQKECSIIAVRRFMKGPPDTPIFQVGVRRPNVALPGI
jgi:hypothetical protein